MGAEKYLAAVLLALGGEAAPDVDPAGLEDDPLLLNMLDTQNAYNTIDRQIFIDILMHTLMYDYGPLNQNNSLPHLKSLRFTFPPLGHFTGIRVHSPSTLRTVYFT